MSATTLLAAIADVETQWETIGAGDLDRKQLTEALTKLNRTIGRICRRYGVPKPA